MTTATAQRSRDTLDAELAATRAEIGSVKTKIAATQEARKAALAAPEVDTAEVDRLRDDLAMLKERYGDLRDRLRALSDPTRQREILQRAAEDRAAVLAEQVSEKRDAAEQHLVKGVEALRQALGHLEAAAQLPLHADQAAHDFDGLTVVFELTIAHPRRFDAADKAFEAREMLTQLRTLVAELSAGGQGVSARLGGSVDGLMSQPAGQVPRRALSRDLRAWSMLSPDVRELAAPIVKPRLRKLLERVRENERHLIGVPLDIA